MPTAQSPAAPWWTISWHDDPTHSDRYTGHINDDGSATGTWSNRTGGSGAWHTRFADRIKCSQPAAGPPPQQGPPPPPPQNTATVTSDVDVYAHPGGNDQDKLGFLSAGTRVNLPDGPTCPQDADCHVSGPNVPTGNGYWRVPVAESTRF